MQFHQPLDAILNSSVKVRILRFFCRKGGEWNGRRLAVELALNPVTAHKALRELLETTLLDLRKVGNNFVYSLRDDHYLVKELLRPLFQRESRAHQRLLELFNQRLGQRLRSQIVTVAIYGSIARREERPTSDIDLLILVKSEQAKRDIRKALDLLWGTITREFGNALAPYLNTVKEAQQKYRRHLPLFQNIVRQHRLVWGRPLEETLRGRTP